MAGSGWIGASNSQNDPNLEFESGGIELTGGGLSFGDGAPSSGLDMKGNQITNVGNLNMNGQLKTAGQQDWDLIVENSNSNPHKGLLIESDSDSGQPDIPLEIRANSDGGNVGSGDTILAVDGGRKNVGIGQYDIGSGNYPDAALDLKAGNLDMNGNNINNIGRSNGMSIEAEYFNAYNHNYFRNSESNDYPAYIFQSTNQNAGNTRTPLYIDPENNEVRLPDAALDMNGNNINGIAGSIDINGNGDLQGVSEINGGTVHIQHTGTGNVSMLHNGGKLNMNGGINMKGSNIADVNSIDTDDLYSNSLVMSSNYARFYHGATYYVGGGDADNSGITNGVVITPESNPSNGEAILSVQSSGGAERLRVEHAGEVYMNNDLNVDGSISKNGGSFEITHPLNDSKVLRHGFSESPRRNVFYQGEAQLQNGSKMIELPHYFEALTQEKGRNVQLTSKNGWSPLYVDGKVRNGSFTVKTTDRGNRSQKFHWRVDAERGDDYVMNNDSQTYHAGPHPLSLYQNYRKIG